MKTITITDRRQIEDIIRKCPYCTVGMTDKEAQSVHSAHELCLEERYRLLTLGVQKEAKWKWWYGIRKSASISAKRHELVYMHKQVACSYSMKSRSVICKGKVRFIEDMDEKRRILDMLMKQYTDNECSYAEPAVRNVKIWEVKVDEISCRSFGLRPSEVK